MLGHNGKMNERPRDEGIGYRQFERSVVFVLGNDVVRDAYTAGQAVGREWDGSFESRARDVNFQLRGSAGGRGQPVGLSGQLEPRFAANGGEVINEIGA